MTELTAVILTKDAKKARVTKKSVKFADKIMIEEHPELNNFAKVRNQALKKTKTEWVLFVDDDETVTPQLAKEICRAIKDESVNGYYMQRIDNFLGQNLTHGETATVRLLRLARRKSGQFHRPVHEYWYIDGKKKELKNPLIHIPHKSISEFLSKINNYSTLEAKYRKSRKRKSSLFKIICYPPGKFLQNYILRKGFLDGTPGLIMAIMMSFHSFQTWTKLYLLQNKR